MEETRWLALGLFAFVASITPGPNNLLATSSGARFGLRRTLPQVAGVTFGFTMLLFLTALGLAAVVADHPTLGLALRACGYAYLLWLSSRLLFAACRPGDARVMADGDGPLTFWQSALFQFANPKAWMMALSAATGLVHHGQPTIAPVIALGALFAAINFPCVGAWAVMGAQMQRWLRDPRASWRQRGFDAAMGATLLATTAYMIAVG